MAPFLVNKKFNYVYLFCLLLETRVNSQLHARAKLFSDNRLKQKLNGYNISFHLTRSRKHCGMLCHITAKCHSYNFCQGRLCELNYAAARDANDDSWESREWCEYSGSPDSCMQKNPRNEICRRIGCTVDSDEYRWSNWMTTFEITNQTQFLWNQSRVRDCVDRTNEKVLKSNCNGCDIIQTGSVLWVTERRNWTEASNYCQKQGGNLFGQFGQTAQALMQTLVQMTEPLLDYSHYHTYVFTGGYQNGNSLNWKSLDTNEGICFFSPDNNFFFIQDLSPVALIFYVGFVFCDHD